MDDNEKIKQLEDLIKKLKKENDKLRAKLKVKQTKNSIQDEMKRQKEIMKDLW